MDSRYEAMAVSPAPSSPLTPISANSAGSASGGPSVAFLNIQPSMPSYIASSAIVDASLIRNESAPPSLGERAAAGVDALLTEFEKVDSLFAGVDGPAALVNHVTKTATVGRALLPMVAPAIAKMVAPGTAIATQIEQRAQRLAATLPGFVKAGIALKELLSDKEAIAAEGGYVIAYHAPNCCLSIVPALHQRHYAMACGLYRAIDRIVRLFGSCSYMFNLRSQRACSLFVRA